MFFSKIIQYIKRNTFIQKLNFFYLNFKFKGSNKYWENRYASNSNSGVGSYGESAEYKASFLNDFVIKHKIFSVIELGSGDGNQLGYFKFPQYTGLDISKTAIEMCRKKYLNDSNKKFEMYTSEILNKYHLNKKELAISLDVVFHLVEDEVFIDYMNNLFCCSSKFVIIYSWDVDGSTKGHVRQRNFSKWISENISDFKLTERIKSDRFCDFVVYQKI